MAKNGNIFIVYLDNTAIAASKSDEFNVQCDSIEVASPSQGQWREFIAGRKSWGVTCNCLVLSASYVLAKLKDAGTTYTLKFLDRETNYYVMGQAILTVGKVVATKGNLVQASFQFQGTGALTDNLT